MHTKVVSFQALHFKSPDPATGVPREVIMLYALGEDGVIYEFGGQWLAMPIPTDARKHAAMAAATNENVPRGGLT